MIKKVKKPKATLESVNRNIERLAVSVAKGFSGVDEKFVEVNKRFTKIDERFVKIDEKFVKIDEKFDRLRNEMDERFDQVENKIDGVRNIIVLDHGQRLEKLEKGLSQTRIALGLAK